MALTLLVATQQTARNLTGQALEQLAQDRPQAARRLLTQAVALHRTPLNVRLLDWVTAMCPLAQTDAVVKGARAADAG
ncbi:hypothetical protein [Ectothiorhodospira magna]|nr:hypothetical protein [Ectothiorhodospira magna]